MEILITTLVCLFLAAQCVLATYLGNRRMVYVTTCYMHRGLAHDAVRFAKWLALWCEYSMNRLGMEMRRWAIAHIMHHQNTDREGDPHSPVLNQDLAQTGYRRWWSGVHGIVQQNYDLYQDFINDDDKVAAYKREIPTTWIDGWGRKLGTRTYGYATYVWLYVTHTLPYMATGLILLWLGLAGWWVFLLGAVLSGVSLAASTYSYVVMSALVNAWGHSFEEASAKLNIGHSADVPRLLLWVAGEGGQNRHHANQRSPQIGLGLPAKYDRGYRVLLFLERIGAVELNDVPAWEDPERIVDVTWREMLRASPFNISTRTLTAIG